MGTGKEGFNPLPDWSVYGLLQIWENQEATSSFFETSDLMRSYTKKSDERWTVYMKSLSAKGEWSGSNPFEKSNSLDEGNSLISVITRATIKPKLLFKFWKYWLGFFL